MLNIDRPLRYLLRQLVGANTCIVQKQYNKHVSIQFHSLHQLQLHLGPLDSMALSVFLHSLVYLVHEEQGMPVPNDVGNFSHEQQRCT